MTERKTAKLAALFLLSLVLLPFVSAAQCNDGIDNDLDGDFDFPDDSGCSSGTDASESLVLGYAHGCLGDGEYLSDVFGEITYQCESTTCIVCVLMTEAGNYTSNFHNCDGLPQCGFGSGAGGPGLDTEPPELTIFSPTENQVLTQRSVFLSLEVSEKSDIHYQDNLDPRRWTTICSDCSSYSNSRTFEEGLNDLTFRVVDQNGNTVFYDLLFYVDSKDPQIRSTKGFASGLFEIEFKEPAPDELTIHFGNYQTGFTTHQVDIGTDCFNDGENYECQTNVDLSAYDGQQIEYYVSLTDLAGNLDESRTEELEVDYSFPIINSLEHNVEGKYVYFTIDITEPFLKEVNYIDNLESKPRKKKICTKLVNGLCEKKISFKDGDHDITITVSDEAGNEVSQNVQVFTDSKKPKISKAEPKKGFASGLFEVQFTELNPEELVLYYGNSIYGERSQVLNLADCFEDRNKQTCLTTVPLGDYDGTSISYYFALTDRVGQSVSSRETWLEVDTTFPVIEAIDYTIERNRAEIVIEITEQNFDEATYINYDDRRPRETRFCSRLNDGACEKRINLNDGLNRINFQVFDEAGNSVAESLEIFYEG
ncbi:MAG: hypothetical protein KJ600_04125 [Nanoarchaeota archaeon]|nr:hypothetical protein [Nanoarchaeota archaeon]MBU1103714.1 hypothetical protein [Nanoarchaeota archaeon]